MISINLWPITLMFCAQLKPRLTLVSPRVNSYLRVIENFIDQIDWRVLAVVQSTLTLTLLHVPLNFTLPPDIQLITTGLNLRKQKWLLVSLYRPPNQNLRYFINHLSNFFDHYESFYSNYISMGDFNELCSSRHVSKHLVVVVQILS